MQHPVKEITMYIGNSAYGNSTNFYGDVHGDVHCPGRLRGHPEPSHQQCRRDLRVTDPCEDRARIEAEKDKLLKDCYAWVLDDASFQRWKTDSSMGLLWINGDPGKGKTMMTMGIVDELKSNKGPLVSYFFCQNTRPELNNAVSVLRGLLWRIIEEKPGLIQHVFKRYESAGRQLFEGINAIWTLKEILLDMLRDDAMPITYLIVDALDECISDLPSLLRIITDVGHACRSKVKWLVTSRNRPDIKMYLQPDLGGVKVSLEINAMHVSRAVAVFVDSKVQCLVESQSYDNETQAVVRQQLCDKADGTFLWVSLVCKELESVEYYRVREVLEELPPGLDPLYGRMMGHVLTRTHTPTVEFCKSILRSVTLAYRPLRVEEVVVTAGLPLNQFGHENCVKNILGHCGSFLTVRDDTVFFVHLSAKDYFTSGNGRQIFKGKMTDEQERMGDRLLDGMNATLRRDMCGLEKPGVRAQEAADEIKRSSLPWIAYACEHWVQHVQAGARDGSGEMLRDGGKVQEFFQNHILHWLEAMGLLQKMPKAILALHSLQAMLKGGQRTIVSEVVHDALRFAMWSGAGIEEAPLQVYYGALMFTPERSIVRREFSGDMPKWVQVKQGLEKDWGPVLQTLQGHTSGVSSVAFSSDGMMVASGSNDKTVKLWDVRTGVLRHTLTGFTSSIQTVVFSPDSKVLASRSNNGIIDLWDASTGAHLQTLSNGPGRVSHWAFLPEDHSLASLLQHTAVKLQKVNTGNELHIFERHSGESRAVTVWSDGTALVFGVGTVSLLNIIEKETVRTFYSGIYGAMAFSPDGRFMATVSPDENPDPLGDIFDEDLDRTLILSEVSTGVEVRRLEGHSGIVREMIFSPDGKVLASRSHNDIIELWNVTKGTKLRIIEKNLNFSNAVFLSPNSNIVATISSKTVRLRDIGTGRLLQTLEGHSDIVREVAFSPDSRVLASASDDKTVKLWDAGMNKEALTIEGRSRGIETIAFSPDGKMLASTSGDRFENDMMVKLWNISTDAPKYTLQEHGEGVNMVAFSPDSAKLASASQDNTVKIWNVCSGECLQTLSGHSGGYIASVAFSHDSTRLASGSADHTVRIWNVGSGACVHVLWGHSGWVRAVTFSPNSKMLLASASDDRTIILWDTDKGSKLHILRGHSSHVWTVAFSADGKMLASGSRDKTVKLWHIPLDGTAMRTAIKSLNDHTHEIRAVAFSPDGKMLASASDDQTIKLWNLHSLELQGTYSVDDKVETLSFSDDSAFMQTNRGRFSTRSPPISELFVRDQWLFYQGSRKLWLPPEYRAACVAVCNNIVALGHSSGLVSLLEIPDEDHNAWPVFRY